MSIQRSLWAIISFAALIAGVLIYQLVRVGDALDSSRASVSSVAEVTEPQPVALAPTPTALQSESEPVPSNKVSRELGKLLQEVLKAAKEKNWALASQWLTSAESIQKKTAFEDFKIQEMWVYVLAAQERYSELLDRYKLIRSRADFMQFASEHTKRSLSNNQLAILANSANRSIEAIEFAKQAVGEETANDETTNVLIQAYYVEKHYQPCFATALKSVDQQLAENKIPNKMSLLFLQQCAIQTNDESQVIRTMRLLCQYYPAKDYWNFYITRLMRPVRSDLAIFYMGLLQFEVSKASSSTIMLLAADASSDVSFVEARSKAGSNISLPATGARIVLAALSDNLIDQRDISKAQNLLARLQSQASASALQLSTLEKNATNNPIASDLYKLGMRYFDIGEFARASSTLQSMIAMNPMPAERLSALMPLGISQLKSGDIHAARATFAMASAEPSLAPAAQVWATRSYNADVPSNISITAAN